MMFLHDLQTHIGSSHEIIISKINFGGLIEFVDGVIIQWVNIVYVVHLQFRE